MQVKGRTFKISFDFITHKFGHGKLNAFLSENPDLVKISEYTDIDWYPMDEFANLSEKIDKYFGFGDGSLMEELGIFSSQIAFNTSHKLFKDLTPDSLVTNAQALVSSYYSEIKIESKYLKEKKVEFTFKNLPQSTFISKRILGWLKQTMKQVGAEGLHISDSVSKEDYIYIVEWSK